MARKYIPFALFVSFAVAVGTTACGNTAASETKKINGAELEVSVNRVVAFNDSLSGIGTDCNYTIADTAGVNAALKQMKHCGNITIGWTISSPDSSIWLVAYENEPVLSETISVAEVNPIPVHDGYFQVAFRFSDTERWAAITRENIGRQLALLVNGQLMNAPMVNAEITSGGCAASIPGEKLHDYLPDFDLSDQE